MRRKKKVLVVGSAEKSAGGVSSVIKLIKTLPVWNDYSCFWLGTQIQRNYLWKLWYAIKANFISFFIMWRYDIVHFHTVPDKICLIIQLPIFLFALLWRRKIIMHVHMGNQLANHTNNQLFLWCLNKSDVVVLLAKKWQRLFEDKYPLVKTPQKVIYNACEDVREVGMDEKRKSIVMAAFFNENKAPDLLLKAWQSIHDKYPDWKVYMLGNGEVDKYEKMSVQMGLADSVTFTGYIVGKEKEKYFRESSIYCMCSYEEGFPMVVLEAWAYGMCVVTTPVGGLPDVLENGKNSVVFDFGDWRQLASSLETLIENENLRRQISEYSRTFVYEHFSVEKTNEEISEMYDSLS